MIFFHNKSVDPAWTPNPEQDKYDKATWSYPGPQVPRDPCYSKQSDGVDASGQATYPQMNLICWTTPDAALIGTNPPQPSVGTGEVGPYPYPAAKGGPDSQEPTIKYYCWYQLRGDGPPPTPTLYNGVTIIAVNDRGHVLPLNLRADGLPECIASVEPPEAIGASYDGDWVYPDGTHVHQVNDTGKIMTDPRIVGDKPVRVTFKPKLHVTTRPDHAGGFVQWELTLTGSSYSVPFDGDCLPLMPDASGIILVVYGNVKNISPIFLPPRGNPHEVKVGDPVQQIIKLIYDEGTVIRSGETAKARSELISAMETSIHQLKGQAGHG